MDQHDTALPLAADVPAVAPSTALDTQGRSPDDYDWVPVRRRPRSAGSLATAVARRLGVLGKSPLGYAEIRVD